MRHVLEIDDFSAAEIIEILALSELSAYPKVLSGKSVALLFEKPSLRTRNSTEAAVVQLGGFPVSMTSGEVGIDTRESAEDIARTLASYHGFIGARVFDHQILERMADSIDAMGADSGVINLLSDASHPCQALADLATITSHFGSGSGVKVAYVGDSNNVARSLAIGSLLLGMKVAVASPPGYGFSAQDVSRLEMLGDIEFCLDPTQAVDGADAIYTDVWTSMGQEEERSRRLEDFRGFTVDSELVRSAKGGAIVMHCLPAHDGEEITREVLESSASAVWEQAQNRMNVMRGLFLFLKGHRTRG